MALMSLKNILNAISAKHTASWRVLSVIPFLNLSLQMYHICQIFTNVKKNALDAQCQEASGETPCSVRAVALPARID